MIDIFKCIYFYYASLLFKKQITIKELCELADVENDCLLAIEKNEIILKRIGLHELVAKFEVIDEYDIVDNFEAIPDVRVEVKEINYDINIKS